MSARDAINANPIATPNAQCMFWRLSTTAQHGTPIEDNARPQCNTCQRW
jgi:hypothetical protein